MLFFNLQVTCKDGRVEIAHYQDDTVTEAPTCDKTTALLSKKETLGSALLQDTDELTTEWVPKHSVRDVSGCQTLSCAAFLDFTSEQPTADMPEVVQLLWIHVEDPEPSDEILDSSQTRVVSSYRERRKWLYTCRHAADECIQAYW